MAQWLNLACTYDSFESQFLKINELPRWKKLRAFIKKSLLLVSPEKLADLTILGSSLKLTHSFTLQIWVSHLHLEGSIQGTRETVVNNGRSPNSHRAHILGRKEWQFFFFKLMVKELMQLSHWFGLGISESFSEGMVFEQRLRWS